MYVSKINILWAVVHIIVYKKIKLLNLARKNFHLIYSGTDRPELAGRTRANAEKVALLPAALQGFPLLWTLCSLRLYSITSACLFWEITSHACWDNVYTRNRSPDHVMIQSTSSPNRLVWVIYPSILKGPGRFTSFTSCATRNAFYSPRTQEKHMLS